MEEVEHQLLLRPGFHTLGARHRRLEDDRKERERKLRLTANMRPFSAARLRPSCTTHHRTVEGAMLLFDHHRVDHSILLFLHHRGLWSTETGSSQRSCVDSGFSRLH